MEANKKAQVAVEKLAAKAELVVVHPADHEDDPLLSATELAAELHVHVATIHLWANEGRLSYVSVGKGKRKKFRRSVARKETVTVVPAVKGA